MFQHVVYTLPGKELVGVTGLTKAIKEEWEIVVIVQLFYLHLGRDEREGRRVGRRNGRNKGELKYILVLVIVN